MQCRKFMCLWIEAQRGKKTWYNNPVWVQKINMMGIAAWSKLYPWYLHVTSTCVLCWPCYNHNLGGFVLTPLEDATVIHQTHKVAALKSNSVFAIDVRIKETICKNSGVKYTSVRFYWFKYVNKVRNWLGEHKYFQVCHPFQIWTKDFIFR